MANLILDEFVKCPHEECPYKACQWNKYSIMSEDERNEYCNAYTGVASMFPIIVEDIKKCGLYMDV